MELPTGIRSGKATALALILSAVGFSPSVFAVEARVYQLENGGAIAPHLSLEFGQDSNPLRGENGSESAPYFLIEPDARYILQRRNNRLTLGYKGEYLQYLEDYCSEPSANASSPVFSNTVPRRGDCSSSASQTFDKASFQNHALSLEGFLEISRRARADLAIGITQIHQPLGTGLSANDSVLAVLSEPDSVLRNIFRAGFSYGAYQARGEFRLGFTFSDRKYQNNGGRDLGSLSEKSISPSGSLFYRIGSRTQVFAGLSTADVTGGNRERTINRRFVGVEFDASAITSGSIRLSDITEEFDSTRGDLNYTGFDLNLKWKPRRFSTVTIGGGRETERGLLTEGVGITTKLDVEWLHFWRDRISTSVELGVQKNESTNRIVNNDANDRTNILRLEANYNLRRWLDVGAYVQSDNRTGRSVNGESRDYSRSLVGITTNGTF